MTRLLLNSLLCKSNLGSGMNFNQMKSPYSKLKTLSLLQNLDLKTFGASQNRVAKCFDMRVHYKNIPCSKDLQHFKAILKLILPKISPVKTFPSSYTIFKHLDLHYIQKKSVDHKIFCKGRKFGQIYVCGCMY